MDAYLLQIHWRGHGQRQPGKRGLRMANAARQFYHQSNDRSLAVDELVCAVDNAIQSSQPAASGALIPAINLQTGIRLLLWHLLGAARCTGHQRRPREQPLIPGLLSIVSHACVPRNFRCRAAPLRQSGFSHGQVDLPVALGHLELTDVPTDHLTIA